MTVKKLKKTKLPHLNKGLIGNYHYMDNIEYAKLLLEKDMIVNRCWETYQLPLSKQRERSPAGFLLHVSKSNLNNLERVLKKFKASIGFKYGAASVQLTRVLLVIVYMTLLNFKETKLPQITKCLIGNYHYGLNIEHAKPCLRNA